MDHQASVTQPPMHNHSLATQESIGMNHSAPGRINGMRSQEYYLPGYHRPQDNENDTQTKKVISQHLPEFGAYRMQILQQPQYGEATESISTSPKSKVNHAEKRKKTDWGLEPMPVIELLERDRSNKLLNIHPAMFLFARLCSDESFDRQDTEADGLWGNRVASVFRLKIEGKTNEQGVFYFPELHIKYPGKYYLLFTLFELIADPEHASYTVPCGQIRSNVFSITPKGQKLPPPTEPTVYNTLLDTAGAKIRYRKPGKPKSKKDEGWGARLSEVNQDAVGKQLSNRTKRRRSQPGMQIEDTIQRQHRGSLTDSSTGYSDLTAPLTMPTPMPSLTSQHMFTPGPISPNTSFSFGPTQRNFQAGIEAPYMAPSMYRDQYRQPLDVSSAENQYRAPGPPLPLPNISSLPAVDSMAPVPHYQNEEDYTNNQTLMNGPSFHPEQQFHPGLQFPNNLEYPGDPQYPAGQQYAGVQNFVDPRYHDPRYEEPYQDQQGDENYQQNQFNQ